MVCENVIAIMANEGKTIDPLTNPEAIKMTNINEIAKEGISAEGITLEAPTDLLAPSTSSGGRIDLDLKIVVGVQHNDKVNLQPLSESLVDIEDIFIKDNFQRMVEMIDEWWT